MDQGVIEHNGKFGIVIPGVAATNWTGQWEVCRGVKKINLIAMAFRCERPGIWFASGRGKMSGVDECRLLPATSAQEQYDTLFGE